MKHWNFIRREKPLGRKLLVHSGQLSVESMSIAFQWSVIFPNLLFDLKDDLIIAPDVSSQRKHGHGHHVRSTV